VGAADPKVTEKLKLLLVRERELSLSRHLLQSHRSWMSRVQRITAAMSRAKGRDEVQELLANSLIEGSPYEFSAVIPAHGPAVYRGRQPSPEELVLLDKSAEAWWKGGKVSVVELPHHQDHELSWLLGGAVPSSESPEPRLVVMVGRTRRTSGFYLPPWDVDIDHLGYLLETISYVVGAVELRAALEAERNNLVVEVEHATRRLRLALEDAQTSREAAEAASRAKSIFLANMSHELRTPLNAIIGYSELLALDAEDNGNEGLLADLDRIRGAGRHLLALISDILDLSKIEAGRMEIKIHSFDAVGLVRSVCSTMASLARDRHNQLLVRVPDEPLVLSSDEIKFRQVLVNLLGNACKFTENGRIEVHLQPRAEGVALLVRDTGIGMSPTLLGRLFEPFHQGDSGVTGRQGGTGLGLAICYQFCRILGGKVVARSTLGQGSEFEAWLPLEVPDAMRAVSP
jgi:signal transduction histidine kinase